eukprot:scaffold4487_cov273-Chaetoceros_neogracile.AAC.52
MEFAVNGITKGINQSGFQYRGVHRSEHGTQGQRRVAIFFGFVGFMEFAVNGITEGINQSGFQYRGTAVLVADDLYKVI